MAHDKAVSEPVCLADRRRKSASRSQSIIINFNLNSHKHFYSVEKCKTV